MSEAAGVLQPRHGGQQPSAGLERGRRNARCRRQRHRCRDCDAVRADRGRADDGRHHRRRHGAYPHFRRQPSLHRRPKHRAAGGPPRHLHVEAGLGARRVRHGRRRKPERPEGGGNAGLAEGLVRNAAPVRHHEPGGRDAARDQARLARLCGDALSARMHQRQRGGYVEGQGDLGDLSAEGRAAEARRARRAIGICGNAHLHFAAWRSGAVSGTARRYPGRLHEGAWRLHRARGSCDLQDRRAPADPRRLSRLANSGTAAARGIRRAHRADAQHSRRLRYRAASASAPRRRCITSPKC